MIGFGLIETDNLIGTRINLLLLVFVQSIVSNRLITDADIIGNMI